MDMKSNIGLLLFLALFGCQSRTPAKEEFEMKIRCSELLGHQKEIADSNVLDVRVFYSPKLNTCIAAEWWGNSVSTIYSLRDILTGRSLYSQDGPAGHSDSEREKWNAKITELEKSN